MKQKLILLLVAWLPIAAFCDDVKVDKLWYSLNSDFTATVVSSSDDEYSGDIEIPESIKIRQGDNEIEYAVTSINDDAFKNCKSLTSVVIPNSITVIGGHSAYYFRESYINSCGAFMGCENLTSVSIGNKVKSIGSYVFSNCKSLTSITIPNSVETIGSRAFEYCSNLASISIGNGVNKIGQEAFYTCSNLDKVIITDIAAWCKIQFVYDNSGYNVATDNVPSNPLWSAHNLFLNEEELTDLIIPEGVTEINKYAFLYCSSLKSVTLPEGLTSIGISAFLGCSNLTSITIPSSVSNISNIAFRVCPSLTSVTVLAKEPIFEDDSGIRDFSNKANATLYVPKGSKAAYEAADNWKGFKEILELGEEVPDLKDGDTFTALTTDGVEMQFQVISAADKTCMAGKWLVTSPDPETLSIPAEANGFKVVSVDERAFQDCSIQSLIIPEGVTSIGGSAFTDCKSLTSVTIPASLTKINALAFRGCSGMTVYISDLAAWCNIEFYASPLRGHLYLNGTEILDLVVPEGVTSLGGMDYSPFSGCKALTSVTIPSSVTFIGDETFNGCSNIGSMTVASGNSVYDSRNGCNAIIETASATLVSGCKNTVIPEGISTIADYAFYGCSGLATISIPSSVTSIGCYAFSGCSDLTSVTVLSEEPPTIIKKWGEADPFSNRANATLYVPKGSKATYETADYWKEFKEILEIEDENPDLKDGDTFTALTTDGVEMTFKVISKADMTCQVGSGKSGEPAVDNTYQGPVTIPATINEYKVTSVGDYAFKGTYITSAIISEGVEAMGSGIFRGCRYLKELEIPSTVKSIGENTFVVLNDDAPVDGYVTDVETVISHIMEPFEISTTVFGIYNPGPPDDSNNDIGDECARAFTRAVSGYPTNAILYVPSGTIEKYKAIKGWTMFKNIVEMGDETPDLKDGDTFKALTPEGVEMTFKVISAADKTCQVGTGEYSDATIDKNYTGLLTIPAYANGYKVTTIAEWAFYNYSSLTGITISEGIEHLMSNCIEQCNSITSFVLPASVTDLSDSFGGVGGGLKSLSVAEGNTVFDSRDNCNAIIETATNTIRRGCSTSVIPNTVTAIGAWSMGSLDMTTIVIPEQVTSIGEGAFRSCRFKEITIPANIKSVGKWAFDYCYQLEKVTILATKCNIGSGAFNYSYNIKEVVCHIAEPEATLNNIFTNMNGDADVAFTLYVPYGTMSLYKQTTGWDNITNIVEMGGGGTDEIINFADPKVKDICVENWDTNKDGELSSREAAAVTDFGRLFWGKHINSFDEIKYFTGITSLADETFYYNTSLISFTLPSFITSLGVKVFAENYNTKLSVDPGNPVYDSRNNSNAIVETATNKIVAACGGTEIPGSVKTIGEAAFYGSFSLTAIDIPATVDNIEKDAFSDCRNLKSVTVHRAIPLSIDEGSFNWWDQDNGVYQKTKATLYVPLGSKSRYENASGWKDFENIIEVNFGDADGDGDVTLEDVELVKEYIMTGKAEGLIFTNADTNGNKQLNAADIVKMINIIKSNNSKETPDPEAAGPDVEQIDIVESFD